MSFSFTSEQKQTLLWLAVGVALLALLVKLGPILAPFIAAGIMAYALNPVVDWLSARKIGKRALPRALAVLAVILLVFAVLLALALIVVPIMQKEIPLLQEQIPAFLAKMNTIVAPKLHELGIRIHLDGDGIKKMLSQYFSTSSDEIWAALFASLKVGGLALLGWIATLILLPIALFYLLLDWHAALKRIENAIPRRWAGQAVKLADEVDQLLAQYLRGQLLVMFALGVYYSVSLGLAGLEVALPVGIITGLLIFIPYIGFGLGLILALIAAVLQFEGWHGLVMVAAVYGIGQVVESFFLTPRLVGERIGLHPLTVIFALLAFGQLFGFVGVLLALPASAILAVALKHLGAYYINSSFYRRQS